MIRAGICRLWLALAAAILLVAGGLVSAAPALAASDYSLLVLPDQGETAIYNFINSATSSIDMTMYELQDTTVEQDLVNREKAGVNVRVILDAAEESSNAAAFSTLQAGGVGVTYSSSAFTFTHQKTITVNNDESFISTGNLQTQFYSTSRDFGVFDTDPGDVAAIVAVFNADYAKTSITPSDGDDLVWSPTDSQSHLLTLINSAQHTLDVEQEELSDTTLVNAIVADAKRGVTVRVVIEDPSDYSTELNEITAAGGKYTGYSDPNGYYIHAKAVVVDYGLSDAKVFLGSENMTANSLNDNRELGLIVTDTGILNGVEAAFNADFGGTASGTVTVTNPGSQTSTVGKAASLQISAADTAGGTLSYTATGLPAGLSVNSSSGLISGTPTTAGSDSVTVTATDSTGPSGSASFTWTVNSAAANTVTVTNPGSQTGTVGTAASLQISATDSASGQTLTYSATGLPAGLSISSSTGLITGTPTTSGTSTVSVTAKDTTGATGSASFSWTVNAAGSCTASQLLGNPGFETGTAAPWATTASVINDNSKEPPHSGSWDAWLDGYGTTHTDTLSQAVTLPSGCSSYQLSFWLHIDTAETTTTTAYDTLTVQILNSVGTVLGTLATFSNLNHLTGYAQHTYSLAAYAGQTITLKFTGKEDSTKQTSFVVDDTAINT